VFEQGHQFLREREQYLLDLLVGLEHELTEGRSSHITKGSEEKIRLGTLISELEKKVQQPALELLQVRDQLYCINLLLKVQYIFISKRFDQESGKTMFYSYLLNPLIFKSVNQ
jgi:hypothetical protein